MHLVQPHQVEIRGVRSEWQDFTLTELIRKYMITLSWDQLPKKKSYGFWLETCENNTAIIVLLGKSLAVLLLHYLWTHLQVGVVDSPLSPLLTSIFFARLTRLSPSPSLPLDHQRSLLPYQGNAQYPLIPSQQGRGVGSGTMEPGTNPITVLRVFLCVSESRIRPHSTLFLYLNYSTPMLCLRKSPSIGYIRSASQLQYPSPS